MRQDCSYVVVNEFDSCTVSSIVGSAACQTSRITKCDQSHSVYRHVFTARGVLSHSVWARLVASKSDEVSHRQIFIAKTCYIVKSQATHPRKEWRGKNRGKSKTRTARCCCQRRFGSSRSAPVEQAQKISLLRALSVQKVVL